MAKYSTSQVAKKLGVTNSKLYYAIREMNLDIDTDYKGDRVFNDDDIALLKQAFATVESGGTYKQAYNHLVKGEVIEVDHTENKPEYTENIKELVKAISQEVARDNKDLQEKTLNAIEQQGKKSEGLQTEVQELKSEIQELKELLNKQNQQKPSFLDKLLGRK